MPGSIHALPSSRMDYAFRYSLMVEMGDLLPKNEVLKQSWPASTDAQRVLIVANRNALVGRENFALLGGGLVCFAARCLFAPGHEFALDALF